MIILELFILDLNNSKESQLRITYPSVPAAVIAAELSIVEFLKTNEVIFMIYDDVDDAL